MIFEIFFRTNFTANEIEIVMTIIFCDDGLTDVYTNK